MGRHSANEKNGVLVIGDWFIDENWLVAPRSTYSSSHTGDVHYLSKHKEVDKRMISLCGAPEIMAVLQSYFNPKSKTKVANDTKKTKKKLNKIEVAFKGYGVWNVNDQDVVRCAICNHLPEKKKLTPYTIKSLKHVNLTGDEEKTHTGEKEGRLCPYEDDSKSCQYTFRMANLAKVGQQYSTNRIIRCYEGYGGSKPKLLYRFDWELPIKSKITKKGIGVDLDFQAFAGLDEGFAISSNSLSKKAKVKAVIIEDHGKGVITRESIEELIKSLGGAKKAKEIRWYIRTKLDKPEWFDVFKEKNINMRMRVIDFKLATHRKGQRQWTHGKVLGRASLELLGDITGEKVSNYGDIRILGPNCQRAAVIFENNTAIAKDGKYCFNLYESLGERQYINIGRTTMFFNSLIAQDLHHWLGGATESEESETKLFGSQCFYALKCAFEWSKEASRAWAKEDLYFYGEYEGALQDLPRPGSTKDAIEGGYYCGEYDDLCNEWEESSKELGLIRCRQNQNEKELQIWRGFGALDKYICVGDQKRKKINDLLTKIKRFTEEKNPSRPFNCLLYSSPGWGKSYLAQRLADMYDMQYLEFSLSQMASNKDLIDCLDTISSIQNVTKKKLLIFMDEINCEIEGHSAMGLLLSPIYDGIFLREGRTYKIEPAVWVFASTGNISDLTTKGINKGSDFLSRLNGPIIELNATFANDGTPLVEVVKNIKSSILDRFSTTISSHKIEPKLFEGLKGKFRTEQVYLAVSLLNKQEPISEIDKRVLKLFHDIFPINGFRSFEFFISKFKNIERGIVKCSNVPTIEEYNELERHVILPDDWPPDGKKDGVLEETIMPKMIPIKTVVT